MFGFNHRMIIPSWPFTESNDELHVLEATTDKNVQIAKISRSCEHHCRVVFCEQMKQIFQSYAEKYLLFNAMLAV